MAVVKGARLGGVIGERQRSRNHVVEEFHPSSGWTEDSDRHILLMDLPGFKKEEVKLQVLDSGEIMISGERKLNDNKYIYFEKTLEVPANSDVGNITGKFDGEIFYVAVQKKATEKKKTLEKEKEKPSTLEKREKKEEKEGSFFPENVEKMPEKESVWKKGEKMVRKHRVIIVTALVAFSLGVLVSHKIRLAHFSDDIL